jgi:sterol desaturase/sphingolipid hydroxylase (fatty acid hydroxylase superfamily)
MLQMTHVYMKYMVAFPFYITNIFGIYAVLAYLYASWDGRRLIYKPMDIWRALFPPNIYRCATVRFDMKIWAFNVFVMLPLLTFLGTIYSAAQFTGVLNNIFGVFVPPRGGSYLVVLTVIQVLGVYIFGTLAEYGYHYASHKVPFLWSMHKVHHSAEEMSPFTASRAHPLDFFLTALLPLFPNAILLGAILYFSGGKNTCLALSVFGILGLTQRITSALDHTHVPLSYGPINRIWVGPIFHQVHHSIEQRHHDKNFGGQFPFWDLVFGTAYFPTKAEKLRFGLNDAEYAETNPHNSFYGYLIFPVVESFGELRKLLWISGSTSGGEPPEHMEPRKPQ